MLEYNAQPGDTVVLRLQMKDGSTGVFPQAKIYNSSDTLVTTVNLSHVANGLYTGTWTATGEDAYYTQTIIYTNSGHTNQSDIDDIDSDSIKVALVGRQSLGSVGGAVLPKDWDKKFIEAIKDLKDKVDKIETFNPETQGVILKNPIDLSKDFLEIKQMFAIQSKRIKDSIPSLEPIFKQLNEIKNTIDNNSIKIIEDIKGFLSGLEDNIKIFSDSSLKEIKNNIINLIEMFKADTQFKDSNSLIDKLKEIIDNLQTNSLFSSEIVDFFQKGYSKFVPQLQQKNKEAGIELSNQLNSDITKLNEVLGSFKKSDNQDTNLIKNVLLTIKKQLELQEGMLEQLNKQEAKRFASSLDTIDKKINTGIEKLNNGVKNSASKGDIEQMIIVLINELLKLKSSINSNNIKQDAFENII